VFLMEKTYKVIVILLAAAVLFAVRADAAGKKPEALAAKFKPLTGEAARKMIEEIEDALEKVAEKTSSVSGAGTIENEFGKKKNVKEFKFWLKKPGRLRLEFTAPSDIKGTLMVTDGKTFWNHIPGLKKTYKTNLKQGSGKDDKKPLQKELGLLAALVSTPLEREEFWKKFEMVPLGEETVDGHECYVVEFKKKSKTKIKKKDKGQFNQYLWIEKMTGLTWQIELLVFGAPELIRIKTIELNPQIDDEMFIIKK